MENLTMHLRASKTFAEPIQKLLIIRTQDFVKNGPNPGVHKWLDESFKVQGSYSDPMESSDSALVISGFSSDSLLVNPENSDTLIHVVNSESSDSSLPPPSPCLENSDIFVGLPPPTPHNLRLSVLKYKFHAEDFEKPPRLQSKSVLFRSESTACITECDQYKKRNYRNVFYENIFQYDDSTYTYRVYINEPYLKPYHPRMKVRIDRWNRLSDELQEVDHEAVRRHGMWFDNQYRNRSTDDSYKK